MKNALLFLVLFLMGGEPIFGQMTILPLGNSITQGNSSYGSYRKALWDLFQANGISVDFVGSLNQPNGCGTWPDPAFDQDHEGHWGWKVDQILDGTGPGGPWNCRVDVLGNDLSDWLTGLSPDIALVHLGTNDAFQNDPVPSTISEIGQVIDQLRVANPNITIYLATLIPSSFGSYNTAINNLNAQIPVLAANKNTVASPVVLVDQNTGFNAGTDTYDGTHPNNSGEQKMAQNWYNAVVSTLPVGLTTWRGSLDGSQVVLEWETAWELNNRGFELEYKTKEGTDFVKIGFVEGVGTTDKASSYRFETSEFFEGTYVFRLKQIDYDGKYSYSRSLEVEMSTQVDQGLSVFPQPVNEEMNVGFAPLTRFPVEITLSDVKGSKVRVWKQEQDGMELPYTVGALPNGLYFLETVDAIGKRQRQKVWVHR